MPPDGPYPNLLRQIREQQRLLTRDALITMTESLAAADPARYTRVSRSALRTLEAGLSRPQLKTMATLAKALGVEAQLIFPGGPDDHIRR
jgi:transcriptional regulator with XRE-family HTH domain